MFLKYIHNDNRIYAAAELQYNSLADLMTLYLKLFPSAKTYTYLLSELSPNRAQRIRRRY